MNEVREKRDEKRGGKEGSSYLSRGRIKFKRVGKGRERETNKQRQKQEKTNVSGYSGHFQDVVISIAPLYQTGIQLLSHVNKIMGVNTLNDGAPSILCHFYPYLIRKRGPFPSDDNKGGRDVYWGWG
jgi:hypothetical protein